MNTYQEIWHRYVETSLLSLSQQQEVCVCMTEVAYHLGWYDGAILFGESAVGINRHYAGSHKYLCLAYLVHGETEKARKVAAAAVLSKALDWSSL